MTMKTVRRTLLALAVLCAVAVSSAMGGQEPAFDVTGTWTFDVQTEQGGGNPTMTFEQEGEKLTGHYQGTFGEADLTGTVKGSAIEFNIESDVQGTAITSTYKGTIESSTSMKGTYSIPGFLEGTFTGTKK
jgi:hypothetical protein